VHESPLGKISCPRCRRRHPCGQGSPEWSADARTTSASYVAASTSAGMSRGRFHHRAAVSYRSCSVDVSGSPHRERYHLGVYRGCRRPPWRRSPQLHPLGIALRGMVRNVKIRGNLCGLSRLRVNGFGAPAQRSSRSRRARTARPDRTGPNSLAAAESLARQVCTALSWLVSYPILDRFNALAGPS
jgi:hypothetical protein